MLTSTYIHLRGVGYSTERRFWEAGARCWDDFLARPPAAARLSSARLAEVMEVLATSRSSLAAGDYRFFSEAVPRRDHWRAFPEFGERALYLDIETTGASEAADVTVIGLHDGQEMRQFVRGENLLDAEELLADAAVLVSFFGTGFDVPVLRHLFPRLRFDQLHIDLCHALRRLGFSGGLKSVERQLGISREAEVDGLMGWDAVYLWQQHLLGSREARELLLRYNRADVENMLPLMEFAYRALREKTLAAVEETGAAPETPA